MGRVDALLGEDGLHWLGPNFTGLSLFGPAEGEVASVAARTASLIATVSLSAR